MAEVFNKLVFDDRGIENYVKLIVSELGKVPIQAKKVAKETQEAFEKIQLKVGVDDAKISDLVKGINKTRQAQKEADKERETALKEYEKALDQFDKTVQTVTLNFLEIEDPRLKIETAKKIALDELDKLAAELKEKAKAAGQTPVDIDLNINLLKEATIQEFEQQTKELEAKLKEAEEKRESTAKRFIGGILKTGKSAVTVLAAAASVVGAAILAAGVAMFKLGSNSAAVDKHGQKLKKSWEELKKTLGETFAPFAYAVQKVFLAGMDAINKKVDENKESLASFSIDLAAKVYAAGKTIISFFDNQGLANERALARLKKYGATMEFIFSPRVFTKSGWQEYNAEIASLNKIIDENKAKMTGLGETYKKAYSEARVEIGKMVEDGIFKATKATKEQIAAFNEYQKALQQFNEETDRVNLDLLEIENPVAKIEVARVITLDAIDKLEKDIRAKAKNANQKLPINFDVDIKLRKDQVNKQFDEDLKNLTKELNDKFEKDQEEKRNELILKLSIPLLAEMDLNDTSRSLDQKIDEWRAKTIKEANAKNKSSTGQELIQVKFGVESTLELGKQADPSTFVDAFGKLLEVKWKPKPLPLPDIPSPGQVENHKRKFSEVIERLFPEEDDLKELGAAFLGGLDSLNAAALETTNSQIDQNNRLIDSIQKRLSATQESLAKEEELQRSGSANNVATKKRELAAIRAEEAIAIKRNEELNKKRVRQQLIQDGLTQASNLVTAGTNLFARESLSKGAAGIIFATLAIASMLAFFAKLKSQAKGAAEVRAHRGGKLKSYMTGFVNKDNGRTDRFGGKGHRIEGSNVVVGGKEFIVNEVTATKQAPFLEDLNQGKYDGLNLKTVIRKKSETERLTELLREDVYREQNTNTTSKTFGQRSQEFINSFRDEIKYRYDVRDDMKELKKLEKKVEKRRTSELVTKRELQKMFEDQSKAIRKAILEERPEYIPITENTTGYLKKTPFLSERILLEKPEPVKPSLAK